MFFNYRLNSLIDVVENNPFESKGFCVLVVSRFKCIAGRERVKSGAEQLHALTCTNYMNVMDVLPNPVFVHLHESCVSETFWSAIA